ncbi:type 4a pilus biogenesis protein PilO [Granulosicoccus sp.]|nr:type 4a pilus biogenesis protein PilO [Granulosicoccus sp.]MDB4222482.1 type 4a pilus biogenesis protein PilO [Granulosicoccus sp.]
MTFSDTWEELQNIDGDTFSRIGTAPIAARSVLILLACAVVIAAIYHFLITPKFDQLALLKSQESQLRITFDTEQSKAANRSAYVDQLEEMKKTFNVMLRQLPNRIDIESLLVDLSQTSVSSGLEVKNFKPETEISREFYAEYPIRISVTGQYHQFGNFVSGLAALPRIVTLSDIDIVDVTPKPTEPSNGFGKATTNGAKRLKMDLVATTYRYLEEEEEEE